MAFNEPAIGLNVSFTSKKQAEYAPALMRFRYAENKQPRHQSQPPNCGILPLVSSVVEHDV